MTTPELLVVLFLFVMGTVSLAGYVFVVRPARVSTPEIPADLVDDEHDLPAAQAAVAGMFRSMGEALPGAAKTDGTRKLLAAAGFHWTSALSIYLGIKAAMAMLLALVGVGIAVSLGGDNAPALVAIACLGLGFLIPDRILDRLVAARQARLRRGLPAALELLQLSVEAGQGLDAALFDTARGLRTVQPDLARELNQLSLDLRANPSREDALRNFGTRSRDEEMRKFSGLLLDTDRFGTSLGPALKSHAKYLRTRIRQTTQERARKVGTKLIFPVFFLIFPSVMLVTLGPAAILIMTQMRTLIEP